MYLEGDYFANPTRHDEDAPFKVESLSKLLLKNITSSSITSYADVGCGSGTIVKLLSDKMKNEKFSFTEIVGYDVSPHVTQLKNDNIEYIHKNFLEENKQFDLVTLNDVFEHVTNPLGFLQTIGTKAKYVLMHIPLEDCMNVNWRNLQNKKISNPGHLLFLNKNSAINLVTMSGLKVIDCSWSIDTLNTPTNRVTFLQKIAYPFKQIMVKINPYLYSRIFGFSLVVLAKGNIN